MYRRRKSGRPRIGPELIALIRKISYENPLWGAPRIHGELLKLGFSLAQSTVSKYMLPRDGRPSQSWETFLRNHASAIAAVDLLTVFTLTLERLYVFVALAHGGRRMLHVEVTNRPSAAWLCYALSWAVARDSSCAILVRDNDARFSASFRDRIRSLGLDDRPTRPASPWQNGHVERLIGSIRRECLDHVVVLGAEHLRRLMADYVAYYNSDRTHLALGKETPLGRTIERRGRIVSEARLGGLHRRYRRIR
ncbi:MAG TPA: integrase [Hyphomonadaceae bacterium]|nr:integrase [Hyphomonadaceae bacterium]